MSTIKTRYAVPKSLAIGAEINAKVEDFLDKFETYEKLNDIPILILFDERSKAFYLICHIEGKLLASKTDLEAVLDPDESEDYKLNREIYTDTHAYKLMESDALKQRSFEDIVVEYDLSYRVGRPLKVFGGQHRTKAISEACKKNINCIHGVRVFFNLNVEQRVNIAMVNNTSIAVSNDLLDRMQEDLLGVDLRNWCQSVGLLEKGQNFADNRSPEGIPTVRIARTLLTNYITARDTKPSPTDVPNVCASGPGIDNDYKTVRDSIQWNEPRMKKMGKEFARLHMMQRERIINRRADKHAEFINKAIHACVAASWAYVAGLLQKNAKALKSHYALPDSASAPSDPLNAKALSQATLKGIDPDTYRGLGARISRAELGRMSELFHLQATRARERGITKKLANAAIKSYEAKKAKLAADKALKKI